LSATSVTKSKQNFTANAAGFKKNKTAIFWDVMLCTLVDGHHIFRQPPLPPGASCSSTLL
jgi:hypothetical protein